MELQLRTIVELEAIQPRAGTPVYIHTYLGLPPVSLSAFCILRAFALIRLIFSSKVSADPSKT